MKEGGWALALIGVVVAIIGASMSVSVHVPYTPSLSLPDVGYLPSPPSEVANLHKMHIQALVIQAGLALFIGGIVLGSAGAVRDALLESRKPAADEPPAQTPAAPEPASVYQPEAGVSDEADGALKWAMGIALVIFVSVVIVALIASSRQGNAPGGANLVTDNLLPIDNGSIETLNLIDRQTSAADRANETIAAAENELRAATDELNAAVANIVDADADPRLSQ